MNLQAGGYTLENLSRINIIVAKNGYGKSRILRTISQHRNELNIDGNPVKLGLIVPIIPERGGYLQDDPNTELNLAGNSNYEKDSRDQNQTGNFRQQSMAKFRTLETYVLRAMEEEFERTNTIINSDTFNNVVDKINSLLDNIEIKREGVTFKIYKKGTDELLSPTVISSGESELISLAIEILTFERQRISDRINILCIDEPDLHLHPDLQCKFAELLLGIADDENTLIILTSHNTPIIGALSQSNNVHIGFIKSPSDSAVKFESLSEELKNILPIFGAHPLTSIYQELPILLVEGGDDSRIWNTACRKSSGKIHIYPCETGGNTEIAKYEDKADTILATIYEDAKGYSLQDLDNSEDVNLDDKKNIVRLRTSCRNAENLLLSNEALSEMDTNWETLKGLVRTWLAQNPDAIHNAEVSDFVEKGFQRKSYDIKPFRNDILSICGCKNDWELVVGITISKVSWNAGTNFNEEGSIINYLGEKTVKTLISSDSEESSD